jgi:hypothetical protein
MFKLCSARVALQNRLVDEFTPSALPSGGLGKACDMSLPRNVCALPLYSFSLRCNMVRSSPSPVSANQPGEIVNRWTGVVIVSKGWVGRAWREEQDTGI